MVMANPIHVDQSLADRFWMKVLKGHRCWMWIGCTQAPAGYGRIGLGGKSGGTAYAHRVSYAIHFGDPGELFVLHSCDNPRCVRPDHLFLGTHGDNMADASTKGRAGPKRFVFGERHHNSKPTDTEVENIRAAYPGESQESIARRYGVSQSTISSIVRGKTRSRGTGVFRR